MKTSTLDFPLFQKINCLYQLAYCQFKIQSNLLICVIILKVRSQLLSIRKKQIRMRFASNNNELRKKIQDYSYGLNDLIGKGFSSSVFRGINEKTKEQVAIKVIDLKSITDRSARQMLEGEIDALKKINHLNVLKCHDIYSTINNCYIITEFCNEGDLDNLLKKREKLPQEEAIPIFRDIVNGFKAIVDAGFLHRDLKPANILMKDKVAKIADFGFAKRLNSNPRQTVNVGSPLYMSPEALKNNIYTVKSDIWSLGVMLYEMVHGKAPWESSSEKQLLQKINKQNYNLNRNLSEDLKDFIRKCLTSDELKRLCLAEFQNHPFILRITEGDGIPQLLRKPTSWNEPSGKECITSTSKETSEKHILENMTAEPSSLHHRKNPQSKPKTEKQFTSQINLMRYLYRFLEQLPLVEDNLPCIIGLKFLATKQMLSLLQCLQCTIRGGENIFNFEGWDEFVGSAEKSNYYKQVLSSYEDKYEKNKKQFQDLIELAKKDKKLALVCDTNFNRAQLLPLLSIKYAIEGCKQMWADLCKKNERHSEDDFLSSFSKIALRLDFTMTFYQLNCLLIDNFHEPDYFARNSKIDTIIEYQPATLTPSMKSQLQYKLKQLQIIK